MACCNECKKAQDAGAMAKGATCSPCAAGSCPAPAASPHPKPVPGSKPGTCCPTPAANPEPQSIPIHECECPTLRLDRIDVIITQFWEQGQTDADAITLRVLRTVYPRTPDGRQIDWTAVSIDTATCLLELRRRVRARVAYVLGHHDEDAAQRRWLKVEGNR